MASVLSESGQCSAPQRQPGYWLLKSPVCLVSVVRILARKGSSFKDFYVSASQVKATVGGSGTRALDDL